MELRTKGVLVGVQFHSGGGQGVDRRRDNVTRATTGAICRAPAHITVALVWMAIRHTQRAEAIVSVSLVSLAANRYPSVCEQLTAEDRLDCGVR